MKDRFSSEVAEKLNFYVYRLIDPRNGETFYVGKGRGNRVYAHADGEPDADQDELSDKLVRIRQIRVSGFQVAHVIHRHGLSEEQAFEVEAALLDAYPETTNQVSGRYSDERGLMHAKQIIEKYAAPEATFEHPAILISINRSATERESTYTAVRCAWKLDVSKAKKAAVVLAVRQGLIVGVFIADRWLPATTENFPELAVDFPGRWGFVGREGPDELSRRYLRRRVPDEMRKRGAANPIRYVGLE